MTRWRRPFFWIHTHTLFLGVLPESPLIKRAPLAIKWTKVSGASNPFVPPLPPTFPHHAHGIMGALRPAQEHTHTHTHWACCWSDAVCGSVGTAAGGGHSDYLTVTPKKTPTQSAAVDAELFNFPSVRFVRLGQNRRNTIPKHNYLFSLIEMQLGGSTRHSRETDKRRRTISIFT